MSFISCSAEKVMQDAASRINEILEKRKADDEAEISRAMLKKHFWSKEYFTRAESIEWLDNNSDFWGWRSCYAWGSLDTLKKLALLAKNGDPVYIDEKGAEALWK